MMQQLAFAQTVVIPRDGFPYCEPFTGSGTRANTEYGGTAILTSGNGDPSGNGVLQLTNNGADETGYIYVDLPFSSTYGIKTSFEYFAYSPATPGNPGDGFSFFLFDGALGPGTFAIGGLGGSLGYSPLRYSDGNFGGGYGLKGAYMGIGLDERGNWGNQYEGRYGGFENPTVYGSGVAPPMFPRYPNSIAIRGPIVASDVNRDNGMEGNYTGYPATFPTSPLYKSYPFIDGRIVNNNISDGAPYDVLPTKYFLPPTEQFTIGAVVRATDCSIDGYRKVFIDLKPNGAGSFTITMDMLINSGSGPRIVNIFTNVPYPYPAPQNLKVGFAASTGSSLRSIHEIRNATVEVSSIDAALAPNPPNLDESVCFQENLTFDFEVSLPAQNSFIRCLQLYPLDPGPPNNSPNPNGNPILPNGSFNCGPSLVCAEKCLPENKKITVPGVGVFEAILGELTEGNFNDERNDAEITFIPEPGFFGTHTIYYTVLDNYGLTSFPKTVTVTVNPFPKIDDNGAIIGPTCNGQNDGSIENVVLKDLVTGYMFSWEDEFGNILPASNYTVTETTIGGYIQATVGVSGVNLGKYFLKVRNPATNNVCEDKFPFVVTDERGTPVKVMIDDQEVCEGTPVEFVPELDDPTDASNPQFVWWKDDAKTQAITNGMTQAGVTYNLTGPGVLTITGLAQSGTPYEFFVEVKADVTQSLCATPAGQLKRVQVVVLSPLNIQLSKTDDLCRQSTGQIIVSATGGFPTKTYSIDGINYVSTNTFSNLLPGDYTVYVNAGAQCIGQEDIQILGPATPVSITQLSQTNPSCATNNGIITFEAAGGTPPYTFTLNGSTVNPTLAAGIYTLTGIAPASTYTVAVADANNCPASFTSQNFDAIPVPEFTVTDDQICPSETAVITVDDSGKSNATNIVYTWTSTNGDALVNGGGVTYNQNPTTGELTVSGLTEDQLIYEYKLQVTGDNVCTPTAEIATVTITPTPKVETPVITPVSCNSGADGTIILTPTDPATASDYEYSINAGNNYQNSSSFLGLIAGTYTIRVRSKIGSQCYKDIPGLVVTEPTALTIARTYEDPTCGISNGEITVTVGGGIPDYTVQAILNGAVVQTLPYTTTPITFTGLAPGTYTISVKDQNDCPISDTVTLTNDPGFDFTIDPMSDETCFGQTAEIKPNFSTSGTATIKWYKDAAGTQLVTSSATPDASGVVTTIASDFTLTVVGLPEGIHSYFLEVTGAGYCPYPLFEAKIEVFPELTGTLDPTPEICFGENNGTITVNASGGNNDYSYSLNGGVPQSGKVFSGLAPGNYTVDISTSNGCSISLATIIEGPTSAITTNTPGIIKESCNLGNGIIENLVISGGWGDYTVEWRKGSNTGSVVPGDETGAVNLVPDTYFLLVTDGKGCKEEFSFTVDAVPDPDYQMTAPIKSCADLPIEFTPILTVPGSAQTEVKWYKKPNKQEEIQTGPDPIDSDVIYTIDDTDWSNPKLIITGLKPGSYIYYFYVECTGQVLEANVEIFETPAVEFNPTPVQCFGDTNGKIKVAAGASPSQVYSIDGGSPMTQAELEAMTFAAKEYTIKIEQAGVGCPAIKKVKVEGPAAPISIIPPTVANSSCSLDNGSIKGLVISGGWGNYIVEWRKGSETGAIVAGDETGALNLAPAIYYLLIKDDKGCIYPTMSYEVKADPLPDYQVQQSMAECADIPIVIAPVNQVPGSTAQEVKWYKGPNQTGEITSGSDPSNPSVTYVIDDADWNKPTLTITGLKPDTYTFYVYSTCTGQELPVEIEIFPTPDVTFTATPVQCFGDTNGKIKVATGASPSQVYSVDGGAPLTQTELEAMTFAAKKYTIEIEQAGVGCPATKKIIVEGPPAALSALPLTKDNPACGQNVGKIYTTITGGWSPYKVELFKDGSNIKTETVDGPDYKAENLAPGDYFLRITDKEGCSITTDPINLEYGPTLIDVQPIQICEGEAAVLVPTTNPPATGATFEWFKDFAATIPIISSPTADANGHIFQVASNGTLTIQGLDNADSPKEYFVRAVGGDVCPGNVGTAKVGIFDQPVVVVKSISQIVCFGDKATVILEGSGGSGTYEYSIAGSPFQSSPEFNLPAGTYIATVRSGGCDNTLPGIVVQGPSAPISNSKPFISNPTCSQPNGVIKFQISGGYGNYQVESFKDGLSLGSLSVPTGDFTLNNQTAGEYKFVITDEKGCEYTVTDPVTLVDGLTPLVAQDQQICEGEVVSITPSSSQLGITPTFIWYQNADATGEITSGVINGATYNIGTDGTMTITGLPAQLADYTYYVEISGPGVCPPPLLAVKVKVSAIPNLKVSNPSIVCDPTQTVDLTEFIEAFNPTIYDYQINDPNGNAMQMTEVESVDMSGSYTVQSSVKGSTCYSDVKRIQVKIATTLLKAEFNYQADLGGGNILVNDVVQILEPVDFIDISKGNVAIWNWDFGDGTSSTDENPKHTFTTKGVFTVTLTTIDTIGCISIYQRVIDVRNDYLIMIPNAFTPDGSKNLYFKPQFRGIASMEFYVFNTWGELIFEANSLETLGWDGTLEGKETPNGNYVYKAIFKTRSGEKVEKAGVFILIR